MNRNGDFFSTTFNALFVAVAVMLCIFFGNASAQFAPGLNGQNGIFSVPSVGIGEQGRFAISFEGEYGRAGDTTNRSTFIADLNLLRNVSVGIGLGYDNPVGGKLHEQFSMNLRAMILDFTEQSWWNAGVEISGLNDRGLDSNGQTFLRGGGRVIAGLRPWWRIWLQGYVGKNFGSEFAGMVQPGTLTWGGGAIIRIIPECSLLGEYSNGYFANDPEVKVAMAGVRIFPTQQFSVSAGYGAENLPDGTKQSIVTIGLTYASGLMNMIEVGGANDIAAPFARAPVTTPRSDTAMISKSGSAVTMDAFTLPVQEDALIKNSLALVRPPAGATILDVIDSTKFLSDIQHLATAEDTSLMLQVTGTESATTLGTISRITSQAQLVQWAQTAGLPIERIILRDQYSAHRTTEPIAYGIFRASRRATLFTELAHVAANRVAETIDSLSSLLSASTLNNQARIVVESAYINFADVKAAYALQDMMYSQSLFPSYGIDIIFRKITGASRIVLMVAP